MLGVLGEYVAKIFEEGKGRPLYIVADTWNVALETGHRADGLGSGVERAAATSGKER
jgi:hypothetical protein